VDGPEMSRRFDTASDSGISEFLEIRDFTHIYIRYNMYFIDSYTILFEKPEGKRALGRPKCRWENNIRKDLRETGWEGVDWMLMAEGPVADSCEYGNEPLGSITGREFLWLSASQEGLCSTQLFHETYKFYSRHFSPREYLDVSKILLRPLSNMSPATN
jgi:hypothetical protein